MKKADKSTWFLNVIFNRLPFYLNALWAILSHKNLQKTLKTLNYCKSYSTIISNV